MMREVLYYERQSFQAWANALALGSGVVGLVLLLPLPGGDETIGPERGIPGAVLLLIAVVTLNLLTMSTWVYPDEIKVQFGRLIPYYHRHIPLDKVREVRVVEYKPIRQAGGWGIRYGTFEGADTQYLNAKGSRGVLVRGNERRVIIGTRHPERLAEAIERALSDVPAGTGDDSDDTETE